MAKDSLDTRLCNVNGNTATSGPGVQVASPSLIDLGFSYYGEQVTKYAVLTEKIQQRRVLELQSQHYRSRLLLVDMQR
jgi:hypothetical protein